MAFVSRSTPYIVHSAVIKYDWKAVATENNHEKKLLTNQSINRSSARALPHLPRHIQKLLQSNGTRDQQYGYITSGQGRHIIHVQHKYDGYIVFIATLSINNTMKLNRESAMNVLQREGNVYQMRGKASSTQRKTFSILRNHLEDCERSVNTGEENSGEQCGSEESEESETECETECESECESECETCDLIW